MKGLYSCVFFLLISHFSFSQSVGDFRSATSGDWNTLATWQQWNGTTWVAASSIPNNSASLITIQGHTVTVSDAQTASNLTVSANASAILSIVSMGELQLTGALRVGTQVGRGRITVSGSPNGIPNVGVLQFNDNASFVSGAPSNVSFNDGGVYRLNFSSGGTIYNFSMNSGSTLEFTGYSDASAVAPSLSGGTPKAFHHVRWNCTSQGADINLSAVLSTINGSLTVESTATIWYLLLSDGTDVNVVINGDLNVQGNSNFYLSGYTGAGNSTVSVVGDVNLNTTTGSLRFSPDMGGLVLTGGDGAATLTVSGDLNILSSTSILDFAQGAGAGALTVNGNTLVTGGLISKLGSGSGVFSVNGDFTLTSGLLETQTGSLDLRFDGSKLHRYTYEGSTITSPINYRVTASDTVFLGTSVLTGSGTFFNNGVVGLGATDAAGALQTAASGGGNIRVTGTRTFASNSTIVYNGEAAQFIGNGFPSTGGDVNLIIDNSSGGGVTLSNNLDIVALRKLTLQSGNLKIGSQTLTINGTVEGTGGIEGGPTSNLVIGGNGDFGTLTFAGTNQLLNFTVNRGSSGLVTMGGDLTILGEFTHTQGTIDFSGRRLTIAGPFTNAGGVLSADDLSTLFITGSDAITGGIPLTGAIGTFTLDHATGVTVSSIEVTERINLLSGVLTGNVIFPVQSPTDRVEVLHRRNGSLATPNALTATLYNITYSNSTNIVSGEEIVDGAINNITIAGSGTVTLSEALDVNGYFRINSGTFNSGGQPISIAGDYFKDGGTTDYTGTTITFDGTSRLEGSTAINFTNVTVAPNSSLNLGSVALNVSGNFTLNALGTMVGGSGTTTFNGNTTILIPDASTTPRFHNISINENATLAISCSDCGTAGNRPAVELTGIWNSNKEGAVFTPAQNTSVRLVGTTNQNILIREVAPVHAFWNLELAGSGNATLITTLRVLNDLSLEGTKLLSTGTDNETIYVGRHFIFDGGSFNPFLGTVIFNGSSVQSIRRTSGSGTPTFHNITLEQAGGSFAIETNVNLRNIFTISGNSASVDFDGGTTTTGSAVFTLLSTEGQTASIAAIPNPSVVFGNITTQRFMSGNEGKIYRYISAPVSGARVVDLQGEIPITGSFTGTSWTAPTDCAGCMPCVGCANNNQTMFRLNETITGKTINERYEDFPQSANTETFQSGRGYAVYVREALNPTTWNLRGTVTKGQQTIPVTYSGNGADDGWNLVGNPYPSTIDWFIADGTSSWTRTNIDPTIYLWDESIQNYATYNRSLGAAGTGTFGGSRYISSGQAFWIKTTASSPALIAREGVKANQPTTGFLRIAPLTNVMRITLLANGRERDQAVIVTNIDGATDSYDASIDSYKFYGPVNLYTFTEDKKALAINAMGSMGCSKEVQIGFSGATPGVYAMRFTEFESMSDDADLYLVDKFTGTSFALTSENPLYEFQVSEDSASFDVHRFSLLFSKAPVVTDMPTQAENVCVGSDARIDLMSSQRDVGYYVVLDGTTISEEVAGTGGSLSITVPQDKIQVGENVLMVMAKPIGCTAIPLENSVKVTKEAIPVVAKVENGVSCNGGAVTLKASGVQAGGRYNWYESAEAPEPIQSQIADELHISSLNKSKTYFVSITSALGCEGERVEVKAEANVFEDAMISIVDEKLVSNHPTGNQWFLDGNKIEGATDSEFKPVETGVYRLDVTIGSCISSTEMNFVVTSLDNPDLVGVSIYPNPTVDAVKVYVNSNNSVSVSVYNSLGIKIVSGLTLAPATANIKTAEIDLRKEASGFYLIEILDGERTKLKKILKK